MEKFRITLNGQTYEVEVERVGDVSAPKPATTVAAPAPKAAPVVAAPVPKAAPTAAASVAAGAATVNAPIPGKILAIHVNPGDNVKRGDVLMILEAMKMQNEIIAPSDAKIAEVRVTVGQSVATGDPMIVLS